MKLRTRFNCSLPLLGAFLFSPAIVYAATFTWDGGSGTDSNWATAANWNPDGAPVNDGTADLIFTGSTRLTPTLSTGWSVRSITFANIAAVNAFTIGGGQTITLGTGGIVNYDSDTQTFNNSLSVGAGVVTSIACSPGQIVVNGTIALGSSATTIYTSGSATVNNSITGTGTISKVGGTGTLTLAGAGDTRSYDLVVGDLAAGGTVTLSHTGTATYNSTGSITLINNSLLNINGNLTLDNSLLNATSNGTISLFAGKTLSVTNGADVTLAGGFTQSTASTINITGAGSTFSTASNNFDFSGGGAVNVNSGGALTSGGFLDIGNSTNGTVIVDGSGSSVSNVSAASFLGHSSATGSLTIRNLATGNLGGFMIASDAAGSHGSLSIESGATVNLGTTDVANGAVASTGSITVTGSGSGLTLTGASTLILGAASAGTANLTVSSGGTFNSGTGTVAVGATGTINISGSSVYNANSTMTLNGTLNRDSTSAFNLATGKTLTVQNGGDVIITGSHNIANLCNISITGSGSTWSNSSYLSVNGGTTVQVSAGGALSAGYLNLGNNTSGGLSVSGLGSSYTNTTVSTSHVGSYGNTASLTFSDKSTGLFHDLNIDYSSMTGTNGSMLVQSDADVTTDSLYIAPSVGSNTGTLTVTGSGSTLTQSGASSLTLGATSLSTGTLNVSSSGIFTSGTGTSTVYATGTINITGGGYNSSGNLTLNGGQLNCDASGSFSLAAGKTLTVQSSGHATFAGSQYFTNAGTFVTVSGSGSTLTATNLGLFNGNVTNVTSGGSISSASFGIGANGTGNGTVTVDGAGSVFNGTSAASVSIIGDGGTGSITYSNSSTGTLHSLQLAHSTIVATAGTLAVQTGADVTADNLLVGDTTTAVTGTVTVTGSGSTLVQNGAATLALGAASGSTAGFTVSSGGVFTSGTGLTTVGLTGTINVNGGTYNANGDMALSGRLNRDATGVFNLAAGKTLTIKSGGDAVITGSLTHASGTITLQDSGSTLSTTDYISIRGSTAINVTNGASLTCGNWLDLGYTGTGTAATLVVDAASMTAGTGSYWGANGNTGNATFRNGATGSVGMIYIGYGSTTGSTGNVSVESGASLQTGSLAMATVANTSTGIITVTGTGSSISQTGSSNLNVGSSSMSTATLTVASGGIFTSGTGAASINNTGAVHITGGTYTANGDMSLNGGQLTRDATGTFNLASGKALNISNGGDVVITGEQLFNSSNAISVSGSGSTLSTTLDLGLNGGNTTSVTSGGSVSSECFLLGRLGNGTVTVDGSGSAFNTTSSAVLSALGDSGGTGSLTFSNDSTGTLHGLAMAFTSSASSAGNLTVQSGADVTAGTIWMAPMVSATTANINVTGVGSTLTQNGTAAMVIGATSTSSATLTVAHGGTYTSGTGDISLNPTGSLVIDAGTVNLRGHLARDGGTLNFASGSLSIIDDFTVGTGGLLGATPRFTDSYQFSTTGTTTIDPFQVLAIEGGRFGTGSLVNNSGTLNFSRGTLAITGAGGMTIGSNSLTALDSDSTLEVTNTVTVQSNANLVLDGGTLNAGALVINAAATNQHCGTVSLRNGTGRILGSGTISNSGLLTGDGIITAALTNNAGGELRAENNTTLALSGANGANAGTINLRGGTLEYSQPLTNSATGMIRGHGAIYFNGGLTNQGSMSFSGSSTDLYGNITMSGASARLISSGGGTVTVYDNFNHNGAEVRTSAGCSTTFFGNVTGTGSYTGPGTVYYEGTFSPGSSPAAVTFAGSVVSGSSLATYMELGGLTRGLQYDAIQVADHLTLSGTLSVSLINGFVPVAHNSFDLFDWGTLTGTFSSLNLPSLTSGLTWDTSDLYTTGTLEVVSEGPPAPTGLTVTQQPGLSLRLAWSDMTPPAAGFEVQRALDSGFSVGLTTIPLPAGQTSYVDSGRTPETTYHYRVRALGTPDPSDYSTPAEATTPTRLADWRWVHFGNQNQVGDGADDQDPDHDGVVNLMEYACNLDPHVADAKPLAGDGTAGLPSITIASGGHLRITFLRRTAASLPTITQGVVFSNNLSTWSAESGATVAVEPIDALWERVTLTDPAAPSGKRFARLGVATP